MDLAEYEAIALQLASDTKRLAAIRRRLCENFATHPLFQMDRSRQHIE